METTGKLGVAGMETRGKPRVNPGFPAGFLQVSEVWKLDFSRSDGVEIRFIPYYGLIILLLLCGAVDSIFFAV